MVYPVIEGRSGEVGTFAGLTPSLRIFTPPKQFMHKSGTVMI